MLYNSFVFIFIFLPCVLCLYYLVAPRVSGRIANLLLVAASLVFYGYWEWRYVFLILGSLCFNYLISIQILKTYRKSLLIFGIGANLALLGYYKYAGFFLENVNTLLHTSLPVLSLALPLGISFFTFQQIAFLVDTYHKRAEEPDFSRYSLFVSFFPQLIAGPIVHHKEMMPQFNAPGAKKFNADNFSRGLVIFTMGLAKKVIIADNCAPLAEAVFDQGGFQQIGSIGVWIGVLAYTMQLYFDFSGYSDMAIGLGKFFNINIPQNFNSPYRAVNVADFWRRWHMTLSRFLKEYLYIPLGGNRRGSRRTQVNLLMTMILGGLWHGANWTFVVWGAYHGGLLLIARVWKQIGFRLPVAVARAITFLSVLVGWVFFRAGSMSDAIRILGKMFSLHPSEIHPATSMATSPMGIAGLVLLLLIVNFVPNSLGILKKNFFRMRYAVAFGILFFLCLLSMHEAVVTNVPTKFLYFDF